MNRTIFVFTIITAVFAQRVFALTDSDTAALKQLTKEYVSWAYCGRPVEFSLRLDYKSFEEQRRILIELAEIEWSGTWGNYWRRRGVSDLKMLRALSPKNFWVRFNSVIKTESSGIYDAVTSIDVHAITEARGDAYVIYQAAYPKARNHENEGKLDVLRAHLSEGEWRLVALPNVTAALRRQLEAVQIKAGLSS